MKNGKWARALRIVWEFFTDIVIGLSGVALQLAVFVSFERLAKADKIGWFVPILLAYEVIAIVFFNKVADEPILKRFHEAKGTMKRVSEAAVVAGVIVLASMMFGVLVLDWRSERLRNPPESKDSTDRGEKWAEK